MFKSIIIGVISVVVMGTLLSNWEVIENAFDTSVSYQKAETIEVEVHPEWASDTDAVEAAQAVILRKAQEAELVALEASFASSTAIYESEKETFLERQEELEKLIGVY